MAQPFLDRLSRGAVLCDGAMGTQLYSHGRDFDECFDELNLTQPDVVREIHLSYIEAGAEIIETNTYGANRFKLEQFGLADQVRKINHRGMKLAREAREIAGTNTLIAGAVGPLGVLLEPFGPLKETAAEAAFTEQIGTLLEQGADLLILETFSDLREMLIAIRAAQKVGDLPIVAQMTIQVDGNTVFGATPESFTTQLDEWGADVIGLNCGVGPAIVLNAIEKMRPVTTRKLSAQPNAGLPRDVQGRQFYMCSPEYMAEYSRRIIQAGARFVGGCCGTTPAHIKWIADAVRQFSPRTQKVVVSAVPVAVHELKPPDVTVVPA